MKRNIHKNNVLKLHSYFSNVSIVESAFGHRTLTYKINSKTEDSSKTMFETPELFLNSIKEEIIFLVEDAIKQHTIFKLNFILRADIIQQTKNLTNTFDFQTCNYIYIIRLGDETNIFFTSLSNTLTNTISFFEKKR